MTGEATQRFLALEMRDGNSICWEQSEGKGTTNGEIEASLRVNEYWNKRPRQKIICSKEVLPVAAIDDWNEHRQLLY